MTIGLDEKIVAWLSTRSSGATFQDLSNATYSESISEPKLRKLLQLLEEQGLIYSDDELKARRQPGVGGRYTTKVRRWFVMGKVATLRSKLIRLAHTNPDLRGEILPLLKSASGSKHAALPKFEEDPWQHRTALSKRASDIANNIEDIPISDINVFGGGGGRPPKQAPLKKLESQFQEINKHLDAVSSIVDSLKKGWA